MKSTEDNFENNTHKIFQEQQNSISENNIFIKCKNCGKQKTNKTCAKREFCECIKEKHDGENNKRTQCSTCVQKFRFLKALLKHEKRHEGKGGFICRNCKTCFTSAEDREKHREKEHKVLRCRICNVRFSGETEYIHHVITLHNGRDRELFMCSECGKQFKTKGELTHHVTSKCGTVKKYECSICFQTLMTAGSLHNHMLRHSGQRTYMCRFCAKTFLTAGQLTVHERIHTQEKAFVCEVCNKGFCHRQSLITHSTIHTGIKPYLCEGCGNAFSCIGNLLKHRKTHVDTCGKIPLTTHRVKHPATKMKVQANTPAASKIKTLEKRKRIEQNSQMTNIPQTENWLIENNNVDNNYYKSHEVNNVDTNNYIVLNEINIEKPKNAINETSELPLNTDLRVINEAYVLPDYLNMPQQETNLDTNTIKLENSNLNANSDEIKTEDIDENNDWVDQSNPDFNSDSSISDDSVDLYTRKMKQNKKNKMTNSIVKTKKKRRPAVDRKELKKFLEERGLAESQKASCQYCGSIYSNMQWLMKHEQKHTKPPNKSSLQKIFKCSCCDITFKSREERSDHQQLIHADVLMCRLCDRIFANPDSMKAHVNFYHKGVRRKVYMYICEKCGKVFKQKALLLSHEQSKCGVGPMYKCDICEKKFASKHVLKSHMRIHLPEKSLLCKFCGKCFHWKGQLKIHERSHTGEKPFKCQYCSKSFSYRESLITHNTLHTGIKPHLCESCGSRFSCVGNLLKHKRSHATTCGLVTKIKNELMY